MYIQVVEWRSVIVWEPSKMILLSEKGAQLDAASPNVIMSATK